MIGSAHPVPVEPADRCAVLSQARGEQLIGSAFSNGRLLLVEQPGPWGHSGLTDSHLDRTVAAELASRTAAAGVRLLAIRRPGRTPAGTRRAVALVDCWEGAVGQWWGHFDTDDELADLSLETPTEPGGPISYLVCAHAKRDTCCAVRGRILAAAIEQIRPGQVWECSHTGGHRYAANLLVLPAGMLYGRIATTDAQLVVDAAERGEVLVDHLRGRAGLAPAAQAALAHVYRETGRYDGVRVTGTDADGPDRMRVSVATPTGTTVITVAVRTVETPDGLSCGESGPRSYPEYTVIGG